jgi:hypothetical protein
MHRQPLEPFLTGSGFKWKKWVPGPGQSHIQEGAPLGDSCDAKYSLHPHCSRWMMKPDFFPLAFANCQYSPWANWRRAGRGSPTQSRDTVQGKWVGAVCSLGLSPGPSSVFLFGCFLLHILLHLKVTSSECPGHMVYKHSFNCAHLHSCYSLGSWEGST